MLNNEQKRTHIIQARTVLSTILVISVFVVGGLYPINASGEMVYNKTGMMMDNKTS